MIPPLRELREDILPLAEHFLHLISQKQGKKILGFSTAAQHAISNYPWPGNIREMINLMERSLILCQGPYIEATDLGLPAPSKGGAVRVSEDIGLFSLEDLEKEHIRKVISASGKNLSTAAKILGITRSTLYSKIKKYGLEAVE
jgi:two-component system response regulator HydG